MMKLISFNVNGLRAAMGKGVMDYFADSNADFICLQETKMKPEQAEVPLDGYIKIFHSAQKAGYSGTAVFARREPLSVQYDFAAPQHEHPQEGRVITLEYEDFYLVTAYTPNAQDGLARLDYRLQWEEDFRAHLSRLAQTKRVIVCGDLNVAHSEIDLKNPKTNRKNAGFSDGEREAFTKLLSCGFTDIFRALNPDVTGAYTWWSYRFKAREKNAGWRIDYFLCDDQSFDKVKSFTIRNDIFGSDHCPIELEMDLTC